jgi:hypothetical protein
MQTALQVVEAILFLLSFFGLLALMLMLPIAVFAPARFTRPWTLMSILSLATFACAVGWLLLGAGC